MKPSLFIISWFIIFFSLLTFHSATAQYKQLYNEGVKQMKTGNYYLAIKEFTGANLCKDKPQTNDLKDKITSCEQGLEKQRLEVIEAKKIAASEKAKADSLLGVAELMQSKMETAIFDKAVKDRIKTWKGFNNYDPFYLDERKTILEKLDTLDLSSNELQKLLFPVFLCKNLKSINLRSNLDLNLKMVFNELTDFPISDYRISVPSLDSIPSKFHSLIKCLDIYSCVDSFPKNILSLVQLEGLHFYLTSDCNYHFNILPVEFYSLTNLKSVQLNSCNLIAISPLIKNLSNLNKLELSYNHLTVLPKQIAKLNSLRYLELNENPELNLKELFNTFEESSSKIAITTGDYERIDDDELQIAISKFSELPFEIGNITKLNTLSIPNCKLDKIPTEIGKLQYLTQLNLEHNQISELPRAFENFNKLLKLNLGYNKISEVAFDFGKLSNLKVLALNSNKLNSIPPSIGKLINLNILNLNENNIFSVPSEIGNLSLLKSLDLSSNHLNTIPSEIGHLNLIADLNLASNELTFLPSEIKNLSNLKKISLNNNQLATIPKEICLLKNLKEIKLRDNPLIYLPIELQALIKSKKIVIDINTTELFYPESRIKIDWSNKLKFIPLGLEKLTNLNTLIICSGSNFGYKLMELNPQIGKLTSLIYLDLAYNELKTLPKEIGLLKKLTYLNLNSNKLCELPPEIGKLSSLKALYLYDNNLTNIPSEICLLNNLDTLQLQTNNLINLPSCLKNLSSLKYFNVGRNKLSEIPISIFELIELRTLVVGGNQIKEISSNVSRLKNLIILQVADNLLRSIPSEISTLHNLEVLILFNNQLTFLPEEIKNLVNLKTLNLSDNNFPESEKQKIKAWLPKCEIIW